MDLLLDDTGDLAIVNGDLAIVRDQSEVQQFLGQTLRVWYGEWFLDLTDGVPYQDIFSTKDFADLGLEAFFKARILNVPGIISLDTFALALNRATRAFRLTFTATTAQGTISFEETLP